MDRKTSLFINKRKPNKFYFWVLIKFNFI